jgi:hypothetical protein
MAACACNVGMGVGLVNALKLVHLIPSERLEPNYLARLCEGITFSATILDRVWGMPPVKRSRWGKLADLIRIYRLKPPHRQMLQASSRGRERALAMLAAGELS